MVIIGYRFYSFENEAGKTVSGTTFFLGKEIPAPGAGYGSVEKVSIPSSYALSFEPDIGMSVEVDYNKYGKVARIRAV